MRICFVAHAGSANTASWCNHLADVLGHDVHVVSLCNGAGLSESVTLHVLPASWPGPLCYFGALPQVRRAILRIEPDLVVGYRAISYGFLAAATGFHPLAIAAQGRVVSPPGAVFKGLLARFALKRADVVNSWGPHMTERLVEVGADPESIVTCPRGIDLGLFIQSDGEASRTPSIIVTRTFHRAYRHDMILRALSLVSSEYPDLSAALVGDGEARTELEDLSRELGLSNRVEFPGVLAPDLLAERLRASSLYVSSVGTDGVSASLLEAMASGTYPIVTDNIANRLWIDDRRNGTLVAGRDPEDFARAIADALADDGLRSGAAAINRTIVEERADLFRNMKTIERAYHELVASWTGEQV